jgi:hypothetical protein
MSFSLRQITQRAGGGEIVRTHVVDADTISIGRGADCDLQLPDLAVSLRHAQLRQTGPTRVTIEAAAGLNFEADGKFTARANLDAANKPQITIGGHSLTLSVGETPGEIAITVERLEDAGPKTSDDEIRSFSPGAVGLNKRAAAWVLGSLIAALCLALPVAAFFANQNAHIHADRQWSSGPLSKSHAFLEKDCQSCHQKAFVAVRDEACLTCHQAGRAAAVQQAAIARVHAWGGPDAPHFIVGHADPHRLMRATPLPADLPGKVKAIFERTFNHPNTRCASCHREHVDADGHMPVAGAPPSAPIRAKPALVMAQDCAQCHGGLKARLPDTDLIDTASWSRHPDFRPLITVSPGPRPDLRRIALAQFPRENPGVKFPHRLHLLPKGGVARMGQVLGAARGYGGALGCASCHRPDASGQGFKPIEMTRDCSACHSLAYARVGGTLKLLPHGHPDQVVTTLTAFYGAAAVEHWSPPPIDWQRRQPGVAAVARLQARRAAAGFNASAAVAAGVRAAFSPGGTCYDCHTVVRPAAVDSLAYGIAPVHLTNRYLPWGAFNHAIPAHRRDAMGRETCGACHKARTSDRAEDLLLPRIDQCSACHGKTRAQTPQAAGSDCAECHGYHAPGRPSRQDQPVNAPTSARAEAGSTRGRRRVRA